MLITVHVLLPSGAPERFDDLLRGADVPVSPPPVMKRKSKVPKPNWRSVQAVKTSISGTLVLFVHDHRFPQLNLVAVGVHEPGEFSVLFGVGTL